MNDPHFYLLLKNMCRIRRMEELCAELYTQEKIRGFLHLYIGEEAVATGVMSLLGDQDNVMATYREHGHALLKGLSAKSIMAEMFGKADGCSKGRGGSMHLFSKDHRFFGGCGIVAAGLPQAVGLALAAKKLKENRKTVCFFGEGAMAEGAFHESLNMAQLWKIPILFCCENNYYAMGSALARTQAQLDLVKKASAFNVKGEVVDGMNVLDVVEKTKKALDFITREEVPYFLEFRTYRFKPHSMFDPDLYREKSEIETWKKRCPINTFKGQMIREKVITEDEYLQMMTEIENEMKEAVVFADQSQPETQSDLENEITG